MGPKKIRRKHKPLPSHGSPHASTSQPPPPVFVSSTSSDSPADDTAKAIRTLWRGNYEKSLRLLDEAMAKHGDSSLALLHRAHGSAHAHLAELLAETPKRRRHLQAALASARRAAHMEPNSVEFSRFYACSMYEAASKMAEFDAAIEECDRGLAIENPTDSAIDLVDKKSREMLGPNKRSRVAKVRRQLLELIHKCNTASVTSFVNFLTTQNTPSLPPVNFTLSPLNPSPNSSSVHTDRGHVNRVHIDRVHSYWLSLRAEDQMKFLKPSVQDIMTHYGKAGFTRDHEEVLLDNLYHMEAHKTCQIWRCFRCHDQAFTDLDAFLFHVTECHTGKSEISEEKVVGFLDQEVGSNWVDLLTDLRLSDLDDCERKELLARIKALFGLLIRKKSLSIGCVLVVVDFAYEEKYKVKLDRSSVSSPSVISLLDASGLKKVLEFLELVCNCCVIPTLNESYKERSDWFVEKVELDMSKASNSPCCSSCGFLMLDGVEKERILEWIYEGKSCDESLSEWSEMRREKVERGLSVLRALEKQAYLLKCLYGTKKYGSNNNDNNQGEIDSYELELNKIDALIIGCTMGIKNLKKSLGEISYFDYRAVLLPFMKSFLQARLEELAENDSHITENEEPEGLEQLQISQSS